MPLVTKPPTIIVSGYRLSFFLVILHIYQCRKFGFLFHKKLFFEYFNERSHRLRRKKKQVDTVVNYLSYINNFNYIWWLMSYLINVIIDT